MLEAKVSCFSKGHLKSSLPDFRHDFPHRDLANAYIKETDCRNKSFLYLVITNITFFISI